MPFQFRLQAVQKVHEFKRDEEKQTLAELLAKYDALTEEEKVLRQKLVASRLDREEQMRNGTLAVTQFQAFFQFESRLEREILSLAEKQKAVAEMIEVQRGTVLSAEQEIKKFEKLEEKQRIEYKKKNEQT